MRFILSPEDTPPEDKTIVIEECKLGEAPDLLARAPLVQQLNAALSTGDKTIPALSSELDVKEDTIRKALERHVATKTKPGLFVQLPGEKAPYRWALVAQPAREISR